MPYFEALKSSACDPKIWSMPVAPGLVHPLLGQVPLQMEQPSPTLPLLFPLFWKMTTHSQLFQNTEAVPTPRHIISQGFFFFFFSSFFWETGIKCSTQANWNTGKILSILSIMHGKCPSCCGTHQQFQTFQQLLLWSQSCPSVTQAAKVAPSLYHLIWAENDRQGSKGSHRRVVGLWVQLLKAVRILPAHPLNEDLPLWSFSIAGNFSKSTTCFSRSPEWKLLFCRDEKHGRDFPFCAFGIQRHLSPVSSPHTLALFKATFMCPFTSCYHRLLFHCLFHAVSCVLESFPSAIGQPHSFSFSLSPLISPDSLFSKHNLKWAITFPHILLPFWLTLFFLLGQSPPPPF